MKTLKFFLLPLLFGFIACSNKNDDSSNNQDSITPASTVRTQPTSTDSFETGKVIKQVVCKNDASQSYALYLPASYKTQTLPVIYFFDPHADGELPLTNYQSLADKYHFILIGSNNSKNGNDWSTAGNIWSTLFSDTKSRIKFNADRIYTCGFSGGAKVASYIALNNNIIKGVIVGGAGLPDQTPAGNFTFSFTGIAGRGDMNMTDLVSLNNDFDKTQTSHRIIYFDGKHEWPPLAIMNIAFAGLQFDAMRSKIILKNDSLINNYLDSSKKRVNDDMNTNKLIQAEEECTLSINLLNGLTDDTNWFKQKGQSIINSAVYKQALQQQQNLFATEQQIKASLQQQFQQGDINYWTKTIKDFQAKAKENTLEGAMYQRLVAYLSLAFYSISNNFINNNQNDAAQYFVTLYKMDDATNSEAWYFSAVLNARNNNAKQTEDDLMQAVKNGFNDTNRMTQQPEFQRLASQINFAAIESSMKK